MYDEVLGDLNGQVTKSITSTFKGGSSVDSTPFNQTSQSLMTSMISRLAALEKSHERLLLTLKEKDDLIHELTESKDVIISHGVDVGRVDKLESENSSLRRKVREMETFLDDYGLKWVGSGGELEKVHSTTTVSSSDDMIDLSTTTISNEDIPELVSTGVDTARLIKQIQYLNSISNQPTTSLIADVSRKEGFLVKHDPVSIIIYKDGIYINRGPFRSFEEESTKLFVRDIYDSYFPSEFFKSHPDGVTFKVLDKSNDIFDREIVNRSKVSLNNNGRQTVKHRTIDSMNDLTQPMRLEEFLNRLPKSKILENGTVVNIRGDIEELLKSKSSSEGNHTLETPSVPNEEVVEEGETLLASIGVKSYDGKKTLMVKLKYTDTIEKLRQIINLHFYNDIPVVPPYTLKTHITKCTLDDSTLSIEKAGLAPNARIMILHM
jgi:hypothetical protein